MKNVNIRLQFVNEIGIHYSPTRLDGNPEIGRILALKYAWFGIVSDSNNNK